MASLYIYSADQVMRIGLKLYGFDLERQNRVQYSTRLKNFKAFFGVHPLIIARLWEELQTTAVAEAQIVPTPPLARYGLCTIAMFLHTFHFLKRYPTEIEREGITGFCSVTLRKWCWFFVEKIRALKAALIVWPQDHEWGATNFIISVDGVHCLYHEEKHPTMAINPQLFDHKSNGPGLSYELALDLWSSRLVWMAHHPVTKNNDRRNFCCPGGLRSKIPEGKKAIADNGYRGLGGDPKVATPNSHDAPLLREFKARARMRQESFNQRIKRFACLTTARFAHSRERHVLSFEAVTVICCYEMMNLKPLFHI